MACVSANDSNSTGIVETQDMQVLELKENNVTKLDDIENSMDNNLTYEKTTPSINISSDKVNAKDTLEIYLQNSTGNPLNSKKLNITLNNKFYSLEKKTPLIMIN